MSDDLVKALLSGQQCDEDGVMCIVSRQACHEGADLIQSQAARIERLEAALKVFRSCGCPVCGGDCSSANPPVTNCPMKDEDT